MKVVIFILICLSISTTMIKREKQLEQQQYHSYSQIVL